MTQALALEDLEELTEEHIPVELLADPSHPSNEEFYQSLNAIRRAIVHQSTVMRQIEVQAVKLHMTGMPATKIAEKIDVAPQSVYKYLKKPEATRLRALLTHMQQLQDGPTEEHRKNLLYRIAQENQAQRPSVAVSAIQEINRMSGTYEPKMAGGNLNITINSEILPRGSLDVLPAGMTIEGELADD
jgi:transposase